MTPKCPTFLKEKRWKSGTLWEHLPKRYHFWTIIKQKRKKVGHFGVMDCIARFKSTIFSASLSENFDEDCTELLLTPVVAESNNNDWQSEKSYASYDEFADEIRFVPGKYY